MKIFHGRFRAVPALPGFITARSLRKTFLVLLLLSLFNCRDAHSDGSEIPPDGNVFRLRDVVVQSSETGRNGLTVFPDRTVLDAEKFVVPGQRLTVADLLDKVAGIDVARSDPVLSDGRDFVKIRGLGGRRIMVRIDGRPVRNAGGFGDTLVDWTSLTLEGIERIEIYRGGLSAVYGETVGGTVNIVTKKRAAKSIEASLKGGYAENNARNGSAALAGKGENTDWFLAGGLRSSDGYLKNGDYDIRDFSGRFSREFPCEGRMELSYKASDQDKSLFVVNDPAWPGYDSSYPRVPAEAFGSVFNANFAGDDHYDRTTQYFDANYTQPWKFGNANARLYSTRESREALVYRFSGSSFYDYVWDVAYEDLGWIALNEFDRGNGERTVAGAEGRCSYGEYDMGSPFRSTGAEKGKWLEHWAFYAEDYRRLAPNLDLFLGLRYDRVRIDLDMSDYKGVLEEWSPKSGLTWQIAANLAGFASVCKAFRTPTAMEYGWLEFPTGESLENETAMQYETGILVEFENGNTLRVTGYFYDIDNYVVFNDALPPPAAAASGRPPEESLFNADYLKLTGFELETDFLVSERLSGYFNYTFQNADLGPIPVSGEGIRFDHWQLPKHKANLGLDWRPFDNTRLSAVARFVADRKSAADEKIDGYVAADISLTRFFADKTAYAKLYAANVFDRKYEETFGVPAPERYFGIELAVAF